MVRGAGGGGVIRAAEERNGCVPTARESPEKGGMTDIVYLTAHGSGELCFMAVGGAVGLFMPGGERWLV